MATYKSPDVLVTSVATHSKWNVLHWPLWAKIGAGAFIVAAGVGIGVGVYEAKKNDGPYPDYSYLNYTLADSYYGEDFFDMFDYFTDTDPTDGWVQYVDSTVSEQYNLTFATASTAILRVDNTMTDAADGRYSVRLTSKNQYDTGLFIFDIVHAAYGCSTWPSIWLCDPSHWPAYGEIDVLEAVEQGNKGNQMTLHTSEGCNMDVKREETGSALWTTCLNSTRDNEGCGVKGGTDSYGEAFNEAGGGIYAMELRSAGIRIWMWTRDNIPSEISDLAVNASTAAPDPTQWGTPLADFPGTDCDIPSHFKNQSIIANIDMCGDWAGKTSVYSTQYGCPGTCDSYAQYNASAFDTAYWQWNGFWVFTAEDA